MPHFEEHGAEEDCGLEPIAIVGMGRQTPLVLSYGDRLTLRSMPAPGQH
jgi:hypothetical protein